MKISVFGLGYVGCVSAACLARDCHTVIGVELSPQKVETIQKGQSPILEPGLEEIIHDAVQSGFLNATTDSKTAVQQTDVSLICVGTPSNGNGSLNLQYVEAVSRDIGRSLATKTGYHLVINRSTVLPETVRTILIPILEEYSGKRAGVDFGVCMNPEFMREGSAIQDYDHPSYIVIGEFDPRSGEIAENIYQNIKAQFFHTSLEVAETVKYASNAFHALKVAFGNEIGDFCKAHGVDGQQVMEIFIQDTQLNISPAYLKPGFAFGGSCLPKDLRAMLYRSKLRDLENPLLSAVLLSNEKHIQRGIRMVEDTGRKKVGVLGLSFKSATDDVRESPIVSMIEVLLGRGYTLNIFDENVDPTNLIGSNKLFIEREIPHIASLMRSSINDVIADSEVVVVAQDSHAFRGVTKVLREDQILIDLVGIAKSINHKGNHYEGICW